MKLVTFTTDTAPELGVVDGERAISLSRAAPRLAADMTDLIARWPQVRGEAHRIAGDTAAAAFALGDIRLLAPIRRPGKIMAIGLNYADHVAETGQDSPPHQIWFSKSPTSAHAPYADVEIPLAGQAVDYEAELVAAVGQGGRHITREAAPGALFGFCVGNDVSERAWQMRTAQWVLGKSFDTHAPFGPWITTSDEASDPHGRAIRCLVNGEQRQSSNTGHLIFDVWAQVEHLSKVMTLEPGDLIFTGTPGGVGAAMTPRTFLKAGDVARVEIEGLGAIENRFAAEIATYGALACDVLIVGLGPTGATLAALLGDAGVDVIAIDRSTEVYPLPRAAHFDHEIMRVFQALGIADEVLKHARPATGYEFRSADGEVLVSFGDMAAQLAPSGWAGGYMFNQPGLERALRAKLAAATNVRVLLGAAFERLRVQGDGVRAEIAGPDGPFEIRARYLVGCDGAWSPVREAIGAGLDDLQFDEPWLVIDAIPRPGARMPTINLQICDPARPTTCVLMGPVATAGSS